jgi:hypothetical protein
MHPIRRPLAPVAGLVAALVSAIVALGADRRPRPLAARATGLGVAAGVAAVEAWGRGRPGRAWYGRVARIAAPRGGHRGDAAPAPPPVPPPAHRALVAVVAVGQAQARPGATVMLLALEVHADGLLIHTRVLLDAAPPPPADAGGGRPPRLAHLRPMLDLGDDRGTAYRVRPASGGGGGVEYRFAHHAVPAPPPGGRTPTIALPALRREVFGPRGPVGAGAPIAGPWSFAVDLPTARG